jgi:predicted SAM-dependent methyltransferase
VRLNLGYGHEHYADFVNIDFRIGVRPNLLCDITQGLPFQDSSIDLVLANNFLEHVPIGKTVYVVEEIWRVLKPGGELHHITPSTDGRGAFQDPTHVSFWNINSWYYYMVDEYRGIYGIRAKFGGENRDVILGNDRTVIHTVCHLYKIV